MNRPGLKVALAAALVLLVLILAAPVEFVVAMIAQGFDLSGWVLLIIPALIVAVYLVLRRRSDEEP